MPVRNCCVGCQGPMPGPCGYTGSRCDSVCAVGPPCVHAFGANCCSPCGDVGCLHGARCGNAASFFGCGQGGIGGCEGGLCGPCCSPMSY